MDKCDFPRCRNFPLLGYIGHDVCALHWQKLSECEPGSKTEQEVLKKIKLVRNAEGSVVPDRKVTMKIEIGDYVFCDGEGMAIFPVESVTVTCAFLGPNVRDGDVGSGGNENLNKLVRVQDSKHAEDYPQFCAKRR